MRIQAFLSGDARAERRLERLAANANDLRPAWEGVFGKLRHEEIVMFSTRGHGKWPRNAASTIARKGEDRPLIDTGSLNDALTRRHARGSFARGSRTQAVFGVNDRTIYYSRFVGKRRPFIVDDRTARRLAVKALIEYFEKSS